MQKSIEPHWLKPEVIIHSKLILDTYYKIKGMPLFDLEDSDARKAYLLYHAPFVVVSHGTESDPIFNYANDTAQKLWNLDWEEFVKLPSRQSAEPDRQEDRQRLLATAAEQGYVDGYEGIRKSSDGKRFKIQNVLLWNLTDEDGKPLGQAAFYRNWTYL